MRQAVERLSETGRLLQQSCETGLIPAHRSVGQAADSLAGSSQQLAAFIEQGLEPVTRRLAQLDETLNRFAATATMIRDFTAVRPDIERLSQSLAQAAARQPRPSPVCRSRSAESWNKPWPGPPRRTPPRPAALAAGSAADAARPDR